MYVCIKKLEVTIK